MQNLVVLMEPDSEDNGRITWMFDRSEPYQTSYKTGNMLLNRFCIDEDAAFELAGIYSLWTNSNSEGKELLNLFWITYNEYRLCYVVLYCIAAFWDTSFIILFSRTLDPQRHRFCFWTSNC